MCFVNVCVAYSLHVSIDKADKALEVRQSNIPVNTIALTRLRLAGALDENAAKLKQIKDSRTFDMKTATCAATCEMATVHTPT